MDFSMEYLSFFVINSEGTVEQNKRYRHFKTMDGEEYERSEIRVFLDGEFARIVKRKAEKHPATDAAPTKIGRFVVEPGYELDSNPNYNMIARCREAGDREQFHNGCDDLLRAYISTSSVRGGAFIVARAGLPRYFDAPFLFILKCDFEPKIARITDEESLVGQVDMAISAKSMKSIQYPHMPEEGMLEPGELKIHQASHARYFEEFLAYVSYEQSRPQLVAEQVMGLVQEYMEQKYQEPFQMDAYANHDSYVNHDNGNDAGAAGQEAYVAAAPEQEQYDYGASDGGVLPGNRMAYARQQEAQAYELWAASDKRELQQRWDHETVAAATQRIVEFQPELDMKFHVDDTFVKARLTDYGSKVHFARMGDQVVVLLTGDTCQFDRDFSPVELLHPEDFDQVVARIRSQAGNKE